MKKCIFTQVIAAGLALTTIGSMAGAAGADTLKIKVMNPTKDDWSSIMAVVPVVDGKAYMGARTDGSAPILVQRDDLNGDGVFDEMVFPVSLKAGESRTYELTNIVPRMAVPPVAHAGMYTKTPERRGFEGPGWESDLIGFRLYWDERNASDIFAKTTSTLSLENLARTDVDYHRLTPWGMDVLKVKTAVGIGGFGAFIDGKVEKVSSATRSFVVRADGPYRAVCDLEYTDWNAGNRKLELTARMKISGGQDYADCELMTTATDGLPLPELMCGFVKHTEETQLIQDDKAAIVGRWGNQALGEGETPKGGNLGMAIMTEHPRMVRIAEDDVNHMIILKPAKTTRFRYLVDWYKDPEPAKSAGDFEQMMRKTARKKPIVSFE